MTVFDKELDSISSEYLKNTKKTSKEKVIEYTVRMELIRLEILENILLYDKICFKVFGENVPLIMLINIFGIRNLEKLIEQDAIEFILWTPMVMYGVKNQKGLRPLMSGNHTSAPHSDPEISLKTCFKWSKHDLKSGTRKRLVRKLRDKYILPSDQSSHHAASMTWSAFKNGKFDEYGYKYKDEHFVKTETKKALCEYANNIVEISTISEMDYVFKNQYFNSKMINRSFYDIKSKLKLNDDMMKLFQIENVPNIKELLFTKKLNADEITNFRQKQHAVKFRDWLCNCSYDSDAKDIIHEYLNAIDNKQGLFQTTYGKAIKTMTFWGIGTGISAIIAGPIAPFVGIPVGKALEIGSDIGLDMLDSFLISSLTKGWSPKLFIDNLNDFSKQVKNDV